MFELDTVYDYWRLGNLFVGILCVVWLLGGFKRQRESWNTKTRDFWYSRLAWAVAQCTLSVEGILKDAKDSYSLPLITVAGLVTFRALSQKGTWGYTRGTR